MQQKNVVMIYCQFTMLIFCVLASKPTMLIKGVRSKHLYKLGQTVRTSHVVINNIYSDRLLVHLRTTRGSFRKIWRLWQEIVDVTWAWEVGHTICAYCGAICIGAILCTCKKRTQGKYKYYFLSSVYSEITLKYLALQWHTNSMKTMRAWCARIQARVPLP